MSDPSDLYETLERICDVVDGSEMLRFVLPHDAPHVAELVEREGSRQESPAGWIAVTGGDDDASLSRAGETLDRLQRTLTALGVPYVFLDHAVETPEVRRELWRILRTPTPPQWLLRIGYGPAAACNPS